MPVSIQDFDPTCIKSTSHKIFHIGLGIRTERCNYATCGKTTKLARVGCFKFCLSYRESLPEYTKYYAILRDNRDRLEQSERPKKTAVPTCCRVGCEKRKTFGDIFCIPHVLELSAVRILKNQRNTESYKKHEHFIKTLELKCKK
jgi:hypothetical protein